MLTVLTVDDEPFVRVSMASLQDWPELGYEFRYEAGNGQQALDILAIHPEIDIILLDLSMPVMDGISFLEALQARTGDSNAGPTNHHQPAIIVLSAHDNFPLVRQAFTLGVQDYVLKTEVDGDSLKAILDKVALARAASQKAVDERPGTLDDSQREFLVIQLLGDLLSKPLPQDARRLFEQLGIRIGPPLTLMSIWIQEFEAVAARYDEGDLARFGELFLRSIRMVVDKRSGGQVVTVARDQAAVFSLAATDAALVTSELKTALETYLSLRVEIHCSPVLEEHSLIQSAWENLVKARTGSSRIVMQSRRWLREHFADEGLSLAVLAEHVGVSRNHLSYEFTRECGETITDFLARLRVEEACRLLSATNLKVYEISEKVGYPNVEHFCRVFKKVTGLSPNRYASDASPKIFRDIRQ